MRYYIIDNTNQKIYIDVRGSTRNELANIFSPVLHVHGIPYSVNQVFAEARSGSTGAGTVIGGLVGVVAGPIGMIVGGIAGSLYGNQVETSEKEKARLFNESYYPGELG